MHAMKTAALALLLCAAGCSGIRTLDTSTLKAVSLDELPQIASGVGDGAAKGPGPMIVHIKAGEKVPLHLALDVPFAQLEAGENAIVLTRDVYLYIDPGTAMIGFDGKTFARIGDWEALKELAGVENGTLSVGFGAGKSDGPRIDVKLGLE